jgi:hypothetical protein
MNNKSNAWVPVLAPLLSIVVDQESPDMVLNDFMAVVQFSVAAGISR